MNMVEQDWPALPLEQWEATYRTLHMWTQIVGKIRLALSPLENHWWNTALYVNTRGLTTSPIPYHGGAFEIQFDFVHHRLELRTARGPSAPLRAGSAPSPHVSGRRATICVSSQVGCAVNCKFCFTALLGVKRNLEAGEIVGQIAAVLREQGVEPPLQRVNIVFMGMGEPFLNYDNFMKSVRLLAEGVGIPESRMTVSTAGIVPRIHDFGQEPLRPKLAISLNGSNDALRTEVMPLNRKWDLEELMKAAREFPLRARERLTFEYVLLADVNDAPEQAREVVELVRGIRAKINLIALNPGTELPYRTPEQERVMAFQRILVAAGIPTFVRRPRGRDIFAACGQLKRTVEVAPGSP